MKKRLLICFAVATGTLLLANTRKHEPARAAEPVIYQVITAKYTDSGAHLQVALKVLPGTRMKSILM